MFLPRNTVLPATPLLPYHSLFLECGLADCLWSHHIHHHPLSSNSRSSVPVFIRRLCQCILTHRPIENSVLWKTSIGREVRPSGSQRCGSSPAYAGSTWAPGLKQRRGRSEWVNAEALLQLCLGGWLGSRVTWGQGWGALAGVLGHLIRMSLGKTVMEGAESCLWEEPGLMARTRDEVL